MRLHRSILGTLASLCVVAGGLLVVAAPALAAAPEVPELTVEAPVHATSATFLGVLNPGTLQPPQSGTYKFLYKAGTGTECAGMGGSETSSGLSFSNEPEVLPPETVTGLTPNTEYAVCLSVTNLESPSKTAVSAPVAFQTTIPPEKPKTEPAPQVTITATSAKLEGILNPHSTTKVGGYFAYSNPGGSSCTEGPTAGLEEFEGEKEEKAIAVHATVGLETDRTYRVCLVATNEFGNATVGNEVVVETLAPPPVVLSESAPALVVPAPVTGSLETTLEATVNPNNQPTECYFQYGTTTVTEHKVPCTEATVEHLEQGVNSGLITGLELEHVYHYRIVLKNAKGEEATGEKTFETLFSPSGLQTGAAEDVTAASASLGGKLDAGGEAEYYVEYGTEPCSVSLNSCGTKSPATLVSGKVQECMLGGVLQECVTPIAVSGLEPTTTYHYWLVASNGAVSKPVHGAAEAFTTKVAAPSPDTGLAEEVTATSARLTGELNPGGAETEYYVEYLLPSGSTEKSAAAFTSGKTQASVGPIVVSGLEPNTTYYYWLVAKNSAVSEPVRGDGHQFTTPISQAEAEAQTAANRKPAEEAAAANAAKQKLEEEAWRAAETVAAANAAKQRQYDEIAAETAGLDRVEAEAGKRSMKAEKAKPKPASCRKGSVKKKNKCVPKKNKKKGKVKK
jgi:hypothetical protein